jgi:protein involved in polysaccharide export with SLBB domain
MLPVSAAIRLFGFLTIAMVVLLFGTAGRALEAEPPLQIGDVLTINLPGEAALTHDFQIDRRGRLQLPEVGGMVIAGKTLPQAAKEIRASLAKAYRDLDRLSVTLKERKLLVSVLGYVKTPGPLELTGDATVQVAITAAGGLSQGAQLDKLQVTHADGTKAIFDYKRYLDSGDLSALPKLKPLDVIFVPASPLTGNVQIDFDARTLSQAGDGAEERSSIKIFGEVNTPAIFAFKPDSTVIDMIMRAGGITRYSAPDQIRVINSGKPVIFNLQAYLDSGNKSLLPKLEPGATIFVPKQVEEVRRGALTVYVMGEVAKPGAFETKKGAGFIDILANAGGPTRFADTRQIRLIRADGNVETVDLTQFTESKNKKPLPEVNPGDALFVPEKNETNEPSWLKIPTTRAVQVLGAVYKPGRFDWADDMTLFDLLAQAGGPTARADIANVQILKKEGDAANAIKFNLELFLKGGGSMSKVPVIRAGFVIMVPELPQDPSDNKAQWTRQAPEHSIYVMGQVHIPGRYAFNAGLGFLDIITAANGPTATADLRNIRVSHRGQRGARVTNVNLARYFQTGDGKLLPSVKPGDVIYIPDRTKDYLDQPVASTVRVLGAVGKPGRYVFNDDMTLLDLLAEAGGPTGDAMSEKILVVNMSTHANQARIFDLLAFSTTGDPRKLPVVRAGDLVYLPNRNQTEWRQIMDGFKDVMPILTLIALLGLHP